MIYHPKDALVIPKDPKEYLANFRMASGKSLN